MGKQRIPRELSQTTLKCRFKAFGFYTNTFLYGSSGERKSTCFTKVERNSVLSSINQLWLHLGFIQRHSWTNKKGKNVVAASTLYFMSNTAFQIFNKSISLKTTIYPSTKTTILETVPQVHKPARKPKC